MKRFSIVPALFVLVVILALSACAVRVPRVQEYRAPEIAIQPPAAQAPVVTPQQEVKKSPVIEGRIRVAFINDRPDEFFWKKYDDEFGRTAPRTPYFRTVRTLGHEALTQELRARPAIGRTFHVFVLNKEGGTLLAETATTNPGGWADVWVGPLDKISQVRVQVDWRTVRAGIDVIPSREEGDVFVLPAELQQHDPLYVWFVQTKRPTSRTSR